MSQRDGIAAETTTVNIKAVPVDQWQRARVAAQRSDEPMGSWIGRAIRMLADLEETGPRVLPPEPGKAGLAPSLTPVNPVPRTMTPGELAALMQGHAALAETMGETASRADLRRLRSLSDSMVREAAGLPPRKVRVRVASPVAPIALPSPEPVPVPELLLIEAPPRRGRGKASKSGG